jgi:hypothetical protein
MMQIIKIRLDTGETRECNYNSEEEMFAETEASGEKVIEWWSCC